MVGPSSQVTIQVTRERQTLRTLTVRPGSILVGRDPACDLHLDDRKVSRRHCEIQVDAERAAVMDLESSNGTFLGRSHLPPRRAMTWTPGTPLRVGPFVLNLTTEVEVEERPRPAPVPRAAPPVAELPAGGRARRIACGHATPSMVVLQEKPVSIGRSKTCEMVLNDPGIAYRQCQLQLRGDQVWVSDLSEAGTTRLGNEALVPGVPRVWREGQMLQLGPFSLVQSVAADLSSPPVQSAMPAQMASSAGEAIGARMWQQWFGQIPWMPIALVLGGICLVVGVGIGLFQIVFKPDPTPTPVAEASPTPIPEATATPSPEPEATPIPTETPPFSLTPGAEGWLPTEVAPPTPGPTVVCVPQTAGWLNLPFPYDERRERFGTAEQFRAASQRVAAGGRITSFFDHQLPLYRNGEQRYEIPEAYDTLVLFDGSRSYDKWLYPDRIGDYYSGHPGLDFSVQEWGKSTTPVLAPADGVFLAAGTDSLGNNYVFLEHDQGEDGLFRTSFLHLENDEYFDRMLALEPGSQVQEGERIGTMGNTGNSSGHHLHFEVRQDCNGNGLYELIEAVDPYGFMPSQEIPVDPMEEAGLPCGQGQYLWKYTWEPGDEGDVCETPERRRQLDPTPFQGYVSIGSFIFSTADPTKTTRVPVWLTDSALEKVDIQTINLHRYDVAAHNWVAVPDFTLRVRNGRYFVEAQLNIPGKYTVTGKPVDDIIPPVTTIRLTGSQEDGVFTGAITVELIGQDEGEGVREIRYSIDCGETWQTYGDLPFTLVRGDLAVCESAEDAQVGDEWGLGEDDFLILAAAVDWAGNWEQPPTLQLFKAR
jgi:murein DD-endopeptidase MepM/ murein hydrolase activator NlpD/pSer/pThr/pTyr-binding forkhead associated (FHA) protein